MLKKIRYFLKQQGNLFLILHRLFNRDSLEKRVEVWIRDNGDKTLRLEYDLNAESTVVDLGGYDGEWTSDIFAKYCCNIHVFEPVPQFLENIKRRFKENSKVYVYPYGLSNGNTSEKIAVCGNSSSIFKLNKEIVTVKLVNAVEFFQVHKIKKVDLLKMNIEGAEYDLLDYLISTEFIKNIVNLQVQFHNFVPNAKKRRDKIQEQLTQTHYLTYHYPFVWENWKVKNERN